MECELCGRNTDKLYTVRIEGAVLRVCERCAGLGEPVKERKRRIVREEKWEEVVEGYGRRIREARVQRGLNLKDLASRIGVKESFLKKVEHEEAPLPIDVAKRLERLLGIVLVEEVEEERVSTEIKRDKVTLGDVIRVKG